MEGGTGELGGLVIKLGAVRPEDLSLVLREDTHGKLKDKYADQLSYWNQWIQASVSKKIINK